MKARAILLGDGYGDDIGVINIENLTTAKILEIASLGITATFGKKVRSISAINWGGLEFGDAFIEVQLEGEDMTIHMPVKETTIFN